VLDEESTFFRTECERKVQLITSQSDHLHQQNATYKQRSDKLAKDLALLRKKNKELRLSNINLGELNTELQSQFELIFKENLLFHAKARPGDHNFLKHSKQKLSNLPWKSLNK
jgi:cell division protein FtsB